MITGRIKEGYGMIQRDIMTDETISVYSKAVYCLLISYAGAKSFCYPSLKTMCANLQVSKPTIIKALKELISKEFIKADKAKTIEGEHANNVYYPMYLIDDSLVNEVNHPIRNGSNSQLPLIVNEIDTKKNTIKKNNTFTKKVKVRSPMKFVKPTLQQVIDFFEEKGYSGAGAKKAFDYYEASDVEGQWYDASGNKIISWKMKIISSWFKDEYKNDINKQERIKF